MVQTRRHCLPGRRARCHALALLGLLFTLATAAFAQDRPRTFPETYRSPTAPAPGVVDRLSAAERACFDALQGKVAWNKAGSTQWADSNKLRLCEGTQFGDIRVECFRRQVALHDDWELAVLACRHAEASLQPQRFADESAQARLGYLGCAADVARLPTPEQTAGWAACDQQFMLPADPPAKAMDGVLPALTAQEQECMAGLQGRAGASAGVGQRQWKASSLRKVCGGTPNPGWTVDCVKQQFATGHPETTATSFCNTAMQATLGFTVPPPARPVSVTRTSCGEIVQCMLDTARGFSPADVCDACSNGPLSAVEKLRSAIETISVGSACAAANEIKWLKDTITGGPVSALGLTLCKLGSSATSSLEQYCRGDCAFQCAGTYQPGKQYDGCMLACGCSIGKFLCESVTSYAAAEVCKQLGLPE